MAKNIKKSYKYLLVVAGIIIVLPTIIFSFARLPVVQTFMIQRMTRHISEKIRSTISVGRVEYFFFNRFTLDNVLIKDKNNDTLFFIPKATISIKDMDFKNKELSLGKVTVIKPVVAFISDSTGEMNLMWYIDMLRNDGGSSLTIKINQIDVTDARFSLIDREGKKSNIPTDFNNLRVSDINGSLENFLVYNDTTSFDISSLAFKESAGFKVNSMESKAVITSNDILFHTGLIHCDSSIINISRVRFIGDSATSFSNFIEDVRMDLRIEKSLVSSSDLKYFVPSAEKFDESVWLSGKVTGTVAELRGRGIDITYGDYTRLRCDFDISGLPDIKSSFIYIGVKDLKTNAKDIQKIEIPGIEALNLPEWIYNLGNVSFDGSFTGFTEDFVAYGTLHTKDGTISTDISLKPEEKNKFRIKGIVRGSSIALGRLTGNTDMFGNLSMKADIDGYAYSSGEFSGSLTGLIDSVEVNNYKYRNISLSGLFTDKTWDGNVKIKDNNIRAEILGMFDFSKELPEFDFTLNLAEANLYKLHFDKADTTSALSMLLTANFKGSNIDNLDGEIKLLNSNLRRHGDILELYDFSIKTFNESGRPAISLHTDFLDADLRGYYNFSGIGTIVKSVMSAMMPSRFAPPMKEKEKGENNFVFNINLNNTDKLNEFFRTGLRLAEKTTITGTVVSDTIMRVAVNAKTLSFKGLAFRDFQVAGNFLSPSLDVGLKSSSLYILGQSELKGFSANLTAKPDNFDFSLNWDNKEEILNNGNFTARGSFIKGEGENSNPVLRIFIDSTGIYSRNNRWSLSPSTITIDTSSVAIEKLYIGNQDIYYYINGAISKNNTDTLHVEFKGIDISWLNVLITGKKEDADKISLDFRGKLNGDVLLSDLYNNPLLESNLKISGFSILKSDYGDMSVISVWNNLKKVADVHAFNNLDGKKMLDISGYYDPYLKRLNLTGVADKLPLDALNPLLSIFASGITGTASGKVTLSGETRNLVLRGAMMAENANIKIDYLQTKYRINDSIRFGDNDISFRNVKVTDEKGNPATLNGAVYHNHFKDYSVNLTINTNETQVLNTRPKDNDLFYGTAYATGVTTIKSGPGTLSFDVGARTDNNTKFFIPLNSSETVSDYSFITFVSPDTTSGEGNKPLIVKNPEKSTGIELNFDLEITPDAEVQLIFDPKVGDIMKGHGSGNLNINLTKKGGFKIAGDYIIEDGDYLFTLKNILNKSFSVEDGGKISFNGDIDDAEIEMKAIYKLKASLYEILKDEEFTDAIPVECQIELSGKLFNPTVAFNIYLPLADEETRTYLKNIITTEEELSRQFLYLLVMNRFYSDPSYGSSLTATNTGTSAMAVTTTEMLSNQLSNWLSQISNDFDLGVTYRPGQKEFSDQEVQVALSTQLLDDRVVINGNLDVRGVDNTNQLTGDFDIEYKPKFSNRIRFKVFNRYNNPYTGKQTPYTQGFGIFFKQDFNKFSDLFKKKDKGEMKKEKETKAEEK